MKIDLNTCPSDNIRNNVNFLDHHKAQKLSD